MSAPSAAFREAEHRARVAALQRQLARRELAALLLTTAPDIFYVTGFLTRFFESPTRPFFVLVPASGDPVAVVPSIGAHLMGTTWIGDVRTWDAPVPADDGISLLADAIAGSVPPGGRVGLPMGPETVLRMPLADFFRLSERIAPRTFADATDAVRRVREVKSEAEIDRVRAVCAAAGRAFARVPAIARPGLPLEAVFRTFSSALLEEGADAVPYLAGAAGPDGYPDVISPATAKPLRAGDVLMLDTGASRAGYFCDFDRNFAVGRVGEACRRAHALLVEATEAGRAAARPGATASEVHAAMAAAIRRGGGTVPAGRLGHGLGLQLTEWPSLMPGDDTPLRAGMVLTLEPAVSTAAGRLMVHEENVVVRAGGAVHLTDPAPARLPVIA